jgi:hypothetical protein
MSLNPRNPGANHTHKTSRLSTVPTSASKTRQLSHLHAQLAQLTANMSDMENLLRMTAVQAEGMRGLGGYAGGMYVARQSLEESVLGVRLWLTVLQYRFMAASKVLGEETVNGATNAAADTTQSKRS